MVGIKQKMAAYSTAGEAAAVLRVCTKTIYAYIEKWFLPVRKVGRRSLIPSSAVISATDYSETSDGSVREAKSPNGEAA